MAAQREKAGLPVVRARKADDMEAVFPGASTWVDRKADCRHGAEVPAGEVAEAMRSRIRGIDFPGFKPSVREAVRHDF